MIPPSVVEVKYFSFLRKGRYYLLPACVLHLQLHLSHSSTSSSRIPSVKTCWSLKVIRKEPILGYRRKNVETVRAANKAIIETHANRCAENSN